MVANACATRAAADIGAVGKGRARRRVCLPLVGIRTGRVDGGLDAVVDELGEALESFEGWRVRLLIEVTAVVLRLDPAVVEFRRWRATSPDKAALPCVRFAAWHLIGVRLLGQSRP